LQPLAFTGKPASPEAKRTVPVFYRMMMGYRSLKKAEPQKAEASGKKIHEKFSCNAAGFDPERIGKRSRTGWLHAFLTLHISALSFLALGLAKYGFGAENFTRPIGIAGRLLLVASVLCIIMHKKAKNVLKAWHEIETSQKAIKQVDHE